jgi:energy-coupling factor transporter ATP-binding protein EcfA2
MLGYYFDREFNLLIGYASAQPNIDYFGYMKKMLLTLYNLRQMEEGNLPIHGAMARIVLKNNSSANIIIVGDSGAGKSESLDAFRALAKDYLKTFKIIFDDMGSIKLKDGKVIATGTEIGAFVRLDDLEDGYAFTEMDRAIFMNPDKTNARMIMPITKYQDVMAGYEVDYFLYANNYESKPDKILIYDDIKAAREIFIAGKRMAKGTTSESGIVQSFFANPFGPAQNESLARELIKKYFIIMSEQGVKIGEIYTQLGVPGKEKSGPVESAKELFNIINQ